MACVDEPDAAAGECRQHRNVGMPAQSEDVLDAARLEILHQLVGDEDLLQIARLVHGDSNPSVCGRRVAGPVYRYAMAGGIGPLMRPPCRVCSQACASMPTERERMNSPRPSSGAKPSSQ